MEFRHCFQSEWEKNTRFGAHGFVPNKRFMREGLQIHWLLKPSIWTVLGQFPFLFICFGTNSQRVSDYLKSWFGLRIADIAAVSTPIYWNSQQRSPFLGLPQLCRAFFSCELMPLWRCVRIWAVGFCNQDISRGKSENWHTINKNGNLRKGNIYFQTKLVGGNSFTYSQYLYSNRRNGMRNHQYFRAYIFQAMDCFKENLKTAISSNIQQYPAIFIPIFLKVSCRVSLKQRLGLDDSRRFSGWFNHQSHQSPSNFQGLQGHPAAALEFSSTLAEEDMDWVVKAEWNFPGQWTFYGGLTWALYGFIAMIMGYEWSYPLVIKHGKTQFPPIWFNGDNGVPIRMPLWYPLVGGFPRAH